MGPMAFPANGSSYLGYYTHIATLPRGQPNLLLIGQISANPADCIYERCLRGPPGGAHMVKISQWCSRDKVVSVSVTVL